MTTVIDIKNYPVPSWLDPLTEIKEPDQPEWFRDLTNNRKAVEFILLSLYCLYPILDSDTEKCFQVCSNSISETGWGKTWRGWNFGGWKVKQSWVETFKQKNQGKSPNWFRALGHVNSGDQPVVFYRGFNSPEEFYQEWVDKFVPKDAAKDNRYYKTGKTFWNPNSKPEDWFLELCLAGYKGEVTQANPTKSFADFKQIVKRAKTLFVQDLIGLDADGDWGTKSKHMVENETNLDGYWLNRNQLKALIKDIES